MDKYTHLNIGVLALQGDFERHQHSLFNLGADVTLVRLPVDLERIDALIMPGGESTTMDKLIDTFNLREPLLEFGRSKPVWGTCAGMIMLSGKINDNLAGVKPLGLIDIDVIRNGYGRQVFSFEETIEARLQGIPTLLKVSFIRAPIIKRIGEQVKTLAVFDNVPVLVEENRIMASSFHTELHEDTRLLEYFLRKFCLD